MGAKSEYGFCFRPRAPIARKLVFVDDTCKWNNKNSNNKKDIAHYNDDDNSKNKTVRITVTMVFYSDHKKCLQSMLCCNLANVFIGFSLWLFLVWRQCQSKLEQKLVCLWTANQRNGIYRAATINNTVNDKLISDKERASIMRQLCAALCDHYRTPRILLHGEGMLLRGIIAGRRNPQGRHQINPLLEFSV